MIILSCGHKATEKDGEDGMGISVKVADQARDGSPAISYRRVCAECDRNYQDEGLIVEDEEEFFNKEEEKCNSTS